MSAVMPSTLFEPSPLLWEGIPTVTAGTAVPHEADDRVDAELTAISPSQRV
jgi:hypothetical protein